METGLLHLHSTLRYLLVFSMVISLPMLYYGWFTGQIFNKKFRLPVLITLILTHLQLVIGLVLYIVRKHYSGFAVMREMKESGMPAEIIARVRFYTIEHIAMMLVAVIIITIGYSMGKRAASDDSKFRKLAIGYTLGFLVMFFAIPWPFLKSWATWYVTQ